VISFEPLITYESSPFTLAPKWWKMLETRIT